jgi:hypothetical protein
LLALLSQHGRSATIPLASVFKRSRATVTVSYTKADILVIPLFIEIPFTADFHRAFVILAINLYTTNVFQCIEVRLVIRRSTFRATPVAATVSDTVLA